VSLQAAPGEGGLASIREGTVRIEGGEALGPGTTILVPPGEDPTTVQLHAEVPARVIRVVHGPGHGFVRGSPHPRRGTG
jgi:hypothetical protein